jgi:hypothetical protein
MRFFPLLPLNRLPHLLVFFSLLAGLVLLGVPSQAQAGCGCDKPPPAPAAVIPNVAFPGMPVTFFSPDFQAGQTWTVNFKNRYGLTTATTTATVVLKRDLTDASGTKYTPQLVVTVPQVPLGPTGIQASTSTASFTVTKDAFTVIGKPVMLSETKADLTLPGYETAVGADSVFYLSVSGLDKVCRAMQFGAQLTGYPLRFGSGDIVIRNSQGFFIDLLDANAADHFAVEPSQGWLGSNQFYYFRHSFEQYCQDHQPGGPKEVDPTDPNWHRDGTPHVDYSTLIFAISGRITMWGVEKPPSPGKVKPGLIMTSDFGTGLNVWEQKKPERVVRPWSRNRSDD